jgi:hypothetical protein
MSMKVQLAQRLSSDVLLRSGCTGCGADHLRPSPFLISDDSKKPADSRFLSIYDRLRRRYVLEELRDFLKPLRLPRGLKVVTEQCDAQTRPYMSRYRLHLSGGRTDRAICKEISPNDTEAQNRRSPAPFHPLTLHETAHATSIS